MRVIPYEGETDTWEVIFNSESEALLDCDIKLGTYGDETKDFVKIKTQRYYDISVYKRIDGIEDKKVYAMRTIQPPYFANHYLVVNVDDAHTGEFIDISDVVYMTITAKDDPIMRKRITKTDDVWSPDNKHEIRYIYKRGESVVDMNWRIESV